MLRCHVFLFIKLIHPAMRAGICEEVEMSSLIFCSMRIISGHTEVSVRTRGQLNREKPERTECCVCLFFRIENDRNRRSGMVFVRSMK